MKYLRMLLGGFLLILAVYSTSESASPGKQWEKLVAAANKEGKVMIYGRGAAEYVKVYRDYFQKAFPGIKVNYVGGRSDLGRPSSPIYEPGPSSQRRQGFMNWLLSREGQSAVEKVIGYPSLRTDTPTKKDLRQFTVPKEGADYMVVSLEKYWYLDTEVRALIKTAAK